MVYYTCTYLEDSIKPFWTASMQIKVLSKFQYPEFAAYNVLSARLPNWGWESLSRENSDRYQFKTINLNHTQYNRISRGLKLVNKQKLIIIYILQIALSPSYKIHNAIEWHWLRRHGKNILHDNIFFGCVKVLPHQHNFWAGVPVHNMYKILNWLLQKVTELSLFNYAFVVSSDKNILCLKEMWYPKHIQNT